MDIDAALSAVGGAGLTAAIAKWAIARALSDLQKLNESIEVTKEAVSKIRENLAAITVRLEKIGDHDRTLADHATKIAYMQGAKCKSTAKS